MRILLLLAFFCGLLLFGCIGETVSVKDLADNPADYVGKEITVRGTVEETFKLGKLSGYKLTQGDYSITVSSETLPAEGKEMNIEGTWIKDSIFGYYLLARSG